MSKSLKRVTAALKAAKIEVAILEIAATTRTAQQAADAAGSALDQIVKSIIFQGEDTGQIILFLTAGGNRVDPQKASDLVDQPLGKADANRVRSETGFAIGGVSPIGHLTPVVTYLDPRLLDFDRVWAAAGTPHHIFPIAPATLLQLTKAQVADFVV